MARQRLRGRTWRYFRRRRHLSTRQCLIALTVGFASSLVGFSIAFYANSDYLVEFLHYMFSSEVNRPAGHPAIPNTVENYQPREFSGKLESVNYDYHITYNDFNYLKPESLTYKSRTYSNNIDLLFRFPKQTSTSAVLLIFHSCKHFATEWFHTTERQRIIGAAIDLGYACLAFQATDKNSQCWCNNVDIYENKDVLMVIKGLDRFYREYPKLASLPRFTFGASSGGMFSSIFVLNQQYPIDGQILYNSIILPEILYTYVKAKNYPPTAWIHMLRDVEFASEERINISKQIFREHKIAHNSFPVEPIRLSHTTFYDRIPTITSETSRFIYYRLQQNHWLNYHNFLTFNPRRKLAWQSFLFTPIIPAVKAAKMMKNLNRHKDVISEFLNTVYGEHEISYERSFEALKWIKQTFNSSTTSTDPKN